VLVCTSSTSASANTSGYLSDCLLGRHSEPVQVQRVTDGDTVVLSDERRVRIIGLNTLELSARTREDRQWAQAAKDFLRKLLNGKSVELVVGNETEDQHGRTLGHLVLDNGVSVAESLVSAGLGVAVAVSPNHLCAYHLQKLEDVARFKKRGIWLSPGNWYTTYSRIPSRERGFQVVRSIVSRISQKNNQTSILLNNGLEIRMPIDREFSKNSRRYHRKMSGKKVEVRGWLSSSTIKPQLHLSHPINLRIINH